MLRCLFLMMCLVVSQCVPSLGQEQRTTPVRGLHEASPSWLLIKDATVHTVSGATLEKAQVLVRGSKIIAVGDQVTAPAGTKIIDGTGKHVYPSFIDPFLPVAIDSGAAPSTAYWNEMIRPDRKAGTAGIPASLKIDERRKAGFGAALIAPNDGIVQGSSAVFLFSEGTSKETLLREDVAMHLTLTRDFRFGGGGRSEGGPTSPMGAYALARQTMYDAQWYRDAWRAANADPSLPRPEKNQTLESLLPMIEGRLPAMVKTGNEIFSLRAARFAKEFSLPFILKGHGMEYRRLDEIVGIGVPIIVPINFPDPPNLASPTDALDASLEDLMHWDHAPENPARLVKAGARVALTAEGLERPSQFLENLRLAVKRGLTETDALKAITLNPATILGVEQQIGSIQVGKIANLILTDGPLFQEETKIVAHVASGQWFDFNPPPSREFDGVWLLEGVEAPERLYLTVRTKPTLSASVSLEDPTGSDLNPVEVKQPQIADSRLSGRLSFKPFGQEGTALLGVQIDLPGEGQAAAYLPSGRSLEWTIKRIGDAPKKDAPKTDTEPKKEDESVNDQLPASTFADEEESADAEWDAIMTFAMSHTGHNHPMGAWMLDYFQQQDPSPGRGGGGKKKQATEPSSFPVNYPFGDFGRLTPPEQPAQLLIRNVTVWTCGPRGVLVNGAVLIENGKIKQVYANNEPLPKMDAIDGTGMHLTPGMIDCHSHMASDSGINEVGGAITAEVRIGDFIDCDDMTIYRQLAGGLTAANILHGSANPIGGQNQVVKLRWGLNDEQMKMTEAPAGIKFALGENVKQSNRRGSEPATRYPQTRMGVEQLMHDSFQAAIEYREAHRRYRENPRGIPPRIDLRKETIAEIVEGTRWIHCHSYRQDEILALIRVLDQYKITIGSFQHILEGYKVANEIAQHGGTASAFSDWWAYKYEVIDAIPHAGAMMHQAGIAVSFNSDNNELARHMNHEAAKAVRYGGVSEEEALKFVTLNPAIQLRIDKYVGSIEPGKQADFVLWNGHPLALSSRCLQTWIDGRKYYDRADAEALAKTQQEQRAELIQKALKIDSGRRPSRAEALDESLLWPRFDEYCHGHEGQHDHSHEGVGAKN
jgi:imidazolonepropionase-like amidohydrolase